jgi:hypothetical protein
MRTHRILLETLPLGDERTQRAQAKADQLLWLGDQITVMTTVFTPYLGFANIING